MMKKEILVIVGPTASGKSDLAVELARKLNGEVVSADSRQVYKGLDAGTGKISKSEMKGVAHHLLDVADPKQAFTAAEFSRLARMAIDDIHARGKLPIVVGGTGFYIDALTGAAPLPEVPPNKKLRGKLEKLSAEKLFAMLKRKDPARAKNIDAKNKVRLIRALEIIDALGKVPKVKQARLKYKVLWLGLKLEKAELEARIYKRLLKRLPKMLIEARRLRKRGLSWKRMEELGLEYRYLARLLQKKITKKQFVDELYSETKKYSKRQMTWFKRNKRIHWLRRPDVSDALDTIRKQEESANRAR